MQKISDAILKHQKIILGLFIILAAACGIIAQFVPVNYNVIDYLPDNAASTAAIGVMEEEYEADVPNARAMVPGLSIPEALEIKARLEAVEGIELVIWLDDSVDLAVPLETQDKKTVEQYYKDGNALYSITVNDKLAKTAMPKVREIVGENSPMSGLRVNTTFASDTIHADIQKIMLIAVPIILLILLLTTKSWFEPIIFLASIGIAILLNMGTNIFMGEISFITKGVASILQLAVSMDYAIFILHRFAEYRHEGLNVEEAMQMAIQKSFSSVAASGVTTIVGFLALILLRIKIGPDVGWVMTKGIVISLICVFTLLPCLTVKFYKLIDKTQHKNLMPGFKGFGRFVVKVCVPFLIIFVIVVIPGYLAAGYTDFVYFDMFSDERTDLGKQANAINDVFGEMTTLVFMVEKGDLPLEQELSEKIQELPNVISVLSYADTVGAEIPMQFVPEDQLGKLISPNYSRMIITLNTYMESEETFETVSFIRSIGDEYYPGAYHLAGESCNTYDMKIIIEEDFGQVNLIAILAVFVILLLTFKSISVPFILILVIEGAIWINCGLPYFTGQPLFYIGYLVISSLQLGATVDYAILFTNRYFENRETLQKREAMAETVSDAAVSIFTSGGILFAAGIILSRISSNGLLSQLGMLIGRGALLSMTAVLFVLPALLLLFDKVIQKTTYRTHFLNPGKAARENINNIQGGTARMKKTMKGLSVLLAAAMLFTLSMPVFAAGTPSEKEEVIYILTEANGTIKNINAVNIFGGGDITDYGDYSAVKMLTAGNELKQSGDMITFSADADKVYYQGTMKDTEIPWNISVRYYIDGKEYSAQDIAGKSGRLKIQFKISENTRCRENFFDIYALQATVTLNANNCKNIIASGATEANAGKNKQFMYTILPGEGIDATITADVTDFEMDPISINGIQLNLNIDIDNEELMDEVRKLIDSVFKINDGADSLKDGTSELKTGSSDLKGGTSVLKSGIAELDEGIAKLQEGISFAKDGLNTLNSKSETLVNGSAEVKAALQTIDKSLSSASVTADKLRELTSASGEIKKGITGLHESLGKLQSGLGYTQYKAMMTKNGLDIDALQAKNAQAIADLSAQIGELQTTLSQIEGVSGFEEQTSQLKTQISQLQNVVTLLTANSTAFEGTEAYLNELSGAVGELYSGMAELKEKYDLFDTAVSELANTLSGMLTDISELASGINTLTAKYSELDSGIQEYTDGVAQLAAGYSQIIEGVAGLAKGSKDLSKGSNDLYDGAAKLYDGVIELCDGAKELADGTKEMRKKTTGMDKTVQDRINDMLASIQGSDSEVISFVSNKNTNVDSVQFVIRTDAIEKAEVPAPPAAEKESLNLWQKFLRLFGWY